MLDAFPVVSLHLICGQFSIWFGANILLLGANNLLPVLSDSVHKALYSVHLQRGIR